MKLLIGLGIVSLIIIIVTGVCANVPVLATYGVGLFVGNICAFFVNQLTKS